MGLLDILQHNAVAFYGVVAFISLMVGSFLNVVIHRLPIMMERAWREGLAEIDAEHQMAESAITDATGKQETVLAGAVSISGADVAELGLEPAEKSDTFNLSVPRSRCPACGAGITAWQNIPVISYLLLRGKCASCKVSISARYPIVEFVTMLLSLVVAWQFGPSPQAVLGIVVTWFLVAMSMIDFDTQLLPDNLTLPLMWIGLLAALLPVFADLHSAVIGAAAGYLILWSIYQLFKIITGKEGMGYGDFKLLAALGALMGWQALPMVILLSSLVGAVVGISLIAIAGRDKNIPIPFGPYLAAAGWIALLWGDTLNQWYFGLLS